MNQTQGVTLKKVDSLFLFTLAIVPQHFFSPSTFPIKKTDVTKATKLLDFAGTFVYYECPMSFSGINSIEEEYRDKG